MKCVCTVDSNINNQNMHANMACIHITSVHST